MLNRISGALPVRPFNLALMGPFAQHSGFDWKDLGVLLAWGAAGTLIAVRRFPLGPPTRMTADPVPEVPNVPAPPPVPTS